MDLAFIPSPSRGVVHLGPVPLRGYAFCIIVGVFVAIWLGNRRWIARGGTAGTVADIAVWAVPFGLVGGRLYHVITDYQLYFSPGRNWVDAFKIWEGGLGIWGAVALGAVGAWIGCRRRGIPLPAYADAVAPGVALAQAIGRWGNWFNQELYGRPTDRPWAVEITLNTDGRVPGTYHPTFLYECIWDICVAVLVIWADRRFRLGHGRALALYVAAYCVGRAGTEYLRVDTVNHFMGLRLNEWTSIIVFLLAVVYLVISAKVRPGREKVVEPAVLVAGMSAESWAVAIEDDGSGTPGSADSMDVADSADSSHAADPPGTSDASDADVSESGSPDAGSDEPASDAASADADEPASDGATADSSDAGAADSGSADLDSAGSTDASAPEQLADSAAGTKPRKP